MVALQEKTKEDLKGRSKETGRMSQKVSQPGRAQETVRR